MIWNSPAEFFAMGGYGFYVWGSFGTCALAMIAEPWLAHHRRTTILNSLRRQQQAETLEQGHNLP